MDYIGTVLNAKKGKEIEIMINKTPSESSVKFKRAIKSLFRNKAAFIGALIILTVILTAVLSSVISPYDPMAQNLTMRLTPPAWSNGGNWAHILGTDHLGRDILSRIIYGSKISLMVGGVAVLISGILGTILGMLSGFYGNKIDAFIMRMADIQLAFPFILLALAVMAVLGSGLRNVIIVLGVTGWVMYGRVVRGEVMSIREKEYVEAARAIGNRDSQVMIKHILPNIISTIVIIATLEVAKVIIAESSLTFLGLGVEPSIPTWGSMLADGREYITNAWWVATFPGLAIMFTVLGINLVGDWLRDTLDPRLKT
jgi:peptide/nickel transport system permease protein